MWNDCLNEIDNFPSYVVIHWVARTLYLLKYNEIASKTDACSFLKKEYRNNDIIELVKSMRDKSEIEFDEVKIDQIKNEAKECLKLLCDKGKEFGLTIASSL